MEGPYIRRYIYTFIYVLYGAYISQYVTFRPPLVQVCLGSHSTLGSGGKRAGDLSLSLSLSLLPFLQRKSACTAEAAQCSLCWACSCSIYLPACSQGFAAKLCAVTVRPHAELS